MTKIVVDANVAVALVISTPYSVQAHQQMKAWQNNADELFAPVLWQYEVITAIRKVAALNIISSEKAEEALALIFALKIRQIHPTPKRYQDIYKWAVKLKQSQAYDAVYLALAEQLSANFWTAGKRLVNRAKQLKLTWVYQIG